MAKRTNRSERGKANEAWRDRIHFINFSYDDELEVASWYKANAPKWSDCVEELADSGYSVKISPPGEGDDFWCSVTAKHVSKDLDGHTFTVKYPGFGDAIVLAYYTVFVMLSDGKLDQLVAPKSRAFLET